MESPAGSVSPDPDRSQVGSHFLGGLFCLECMGVAPVAWRAVGCVYLFSEQIRAIFYVPREGKFVESMRVEPWHGRCWAVYPCRKDRFEPF